MNYALIALALMFTASLACEEPDEEIDGSCLHIGNPTDGTIASCMEFISPASDRDAQKQVCDATTDAVWSDGPCDTTDFCGYCETNVPSGTHSRLYYFDTEGLVEPESNFEEGCLGGGANTWVDNPDVTCR